MGAVITLAVTVTVDITIIVGDVTDAVTFVAVTTGQDVTEVKVTCIILTPEAKKAGWAIL